MMRSETNKSYKNRSEVLIDSQMTCIAITKKTNAVHYIVGTKTGFPNLGVGTTPGGHKTLKRGRQGKCKNKILFLFNMGRENPHKIPLIISQVSK